MAKSLNQNDHDLLIRVDSKVGDMSNTLDEIKINLKGLPGIFASREELKDIAKETEVRLTKLENAMEGPKKYIIPAITAISSSVITFLVIQFLEKSV